MSHQLKCGGWVWSAEEQRVRKSERIRHQLRFGWAWSPEEQRVRE
jgi:hypothetical protein